MDLPGIGKLQQSQPQQMNSLVKEIKLKCKKNHKCIGSNSSWDALAYRGRSAASCTAANIFGFAKI